MDGFDLQASFKTQNDTLINVRGDRETFDDNLAHVLGAVEQIKEAEAVFKGDGKALLEQKLGAQKIGEYDEAQGAPAGGYQQTHCNRCKQIPTCPTCNQLCNVTPLSLKNGQYFKHECPSKSRDHKTVWCNEPKD